MSDREHPYAPRLKEQSSRKAGSADGGVSVTAANAFVKIKIGGSIPGARTVSRTRMRTSSDGMAS